MIFKRLAFENYKAFRKREDIELRPLTILIGRNNAGKSVIARLPLLLAHSLSDRAESPFDLEFSGLNFGASFADIVHNRTPHRAVGVGADFATHDGQNLKIFAKVLYFDEYKLQVVQRFELKNSDNRPLTLCWAGEDPLEEMHRYRVEETGIECRVIFRGICPYKISPSDRRISSGFSFGNLSNEMTYLGPFREEPRRVYPFSGSFVRGVDFRGKNAPQLLSDDKLSRKGKVLSAVSDWFSEYLGGWPLDLSVQGDYFSLVLRNPKNSSVEVNIADVGAGIAQVLPIVVQRHFADITGDSGNIEIIEQPELHLHPGAHGPLADLYVKAVKEAGIRCLIETHSENFLLRIRRRIADKTLESDDVVVYWVKDKSDSKTQIQQINIEPNGEVDYWPKGVWSEDFDEVRAIRRAQKRRRR